MIFDSREGLVEHGKMHMASGARNTNVSRLGRRSVIISSIVGGFLGGVVMLIVLMIGALAMGLSVTAFALIMGLGLGATMGSAVMVGVIGHFTVSIVAGAIFGVFVSYVKPLSLKSGTRSLALGFILAIVLYLVFFVPMTLTVFAPVMMSLLGPGAAAMLPDVLVIGLIGHLLYGLILGTSAFYLGKSI